MKYVFKKKSLMIFAGILDLLGGLASIPFRALNAPGLPKSISRLLVVRLDHIGDIIMSTAVMKPLRDAHPGAKIDLLVPSWAFDLVKDNPYVDRVFRFDPVWFDRKRRAGIIAQLKDVFFMAGIVRSGGYDAALDLRGDLREIFALWLSGVKCRVSYGITGGCFLLTHCIPYRRGVHEIEHNMDIARTLGVVESGAKVELFFSKKARSCAESVLKASDVSGPYAVFHVSPGHASKVWESGKFSRVIDHVTKKSFNVVLAGSAADASLTGEIVSRSVGKVRDLSGKTDLEELAWIIKSAAVFVGVDSAPAHIAASVGVPTVVLFSGVNDPAQWGPEGDNVRIVYPGKGKDLLSVGADTVCRAVDEVLSEKINE